MHHVLKNDKEFGCYGKKQERLQQLWVSEARVSLTPVEGLRLLKEPWERAFTAHHTARALREAGYVEGQGGILVSSRKPYQKLAKQEAAAEALRDSASSSVAELHSASKFNYDDVYGSLKDRLSKPKETVGGMPTVATRRLTMSSQGVALIEGGANGASSIQLVEFKTQASKIKSMLKAGLLANMSVLLHGSPAATLSLPPGPTVKKKVASLQARLLIVAALKAKHSIIPHGWFSAKGDKDIRVSLAQQLQSIANGEELLPSFAPTEAQQASLEKMSDFWVTKVAEEQADIASVKAEPGNAADQIIDWGFEGFTMPNLGGNPPGAPPPPPVPSHHGGLEAPVAGHDSLAPDPNAPTTSATPEAAVAGQQPPEKRPRLAGE